MPHAHHFLTCDLGAESGRLMAGSVSEERIAIELIHRFPNTPVLREGSLCWDIDSLRNGLIDGLAKASAMDRDWRGISTDSWGVDYLLFDAQGALMKPVYHYRDERTARGVAAVRAKVGWPEVFAETGIQFMPLNTLYQLAAEPPQRLAAAQWITGIGDGFNHWLGGELVIEESMASTFQLFSPSTRTWSARLLDAAGIPRRIFPRVVPSGTRIGSLNAELQSATGLGPIEIIASCSHDTGAAVAAVPAGGKQWAYLSSGTWSLLGVELPSPILTDTCRDLNVTNEIGFGGSIRLLKNIVGLWIVQECRRDWLRNGTRIEYAELTALAAAAAPFRAWINPSDGRFLAPGGMPGKIASYCSETGQQVVREPSEVIRCVLESLALEYRKTLRQIESLSGWRAEVLHVVGGGSQNSLLNQLTANACGIPVLAGPVEATAIGNVVVQAIATGNLPSLAAARELVVRSFTLERFEPRDQLAWAKAAERF